MRDADAVERATKNFSDCGGWDAVRDLYLVYPTPFLLVRAERWIGWLQPVMVCLPPGKTRLPSAFATLAQSKKGNPMSHRKNHFRPSLESLEGRKLMAGDVVAALEGSFLRIEGDNLDNQVSVAQTLQGDVIVSAKMEHASMA